MSTRLQHQILIARPPAAVFAYVTQPWRWCEWHPSSLGAVADSGHMDRPLGAGDSFTERIALRPLAPLPPTLHRQTRYTVEAIEHARAWQVRGAMRDGWLRLHYRLDAAAAGGTRFERTLDYGAHGFSRLWLPLLRARTEALSRLALERLKARLEAGGDG